jgi:hypothetical protein
LSTTSATRTIVPVRRGSITRLLDRYFYFAMSLLVAAIVVFAFNRTVDQRLFHAPYKPPFLLWVHGAVFTAWLGLFILQSALIRVHKVQWHRISGWFGAAMGVLIPILGVSIAVIMARFEILELHRDRTQRAGFMMIPLLDMVCFTSTFWLAVLWRKRPEYHRRLVFMATCALSAAAWGRMPEILPGNYFYAGVDFLILMGVARDLIVNHRVHPVYRWALPGFIVVQSFVIYTLAVNANWWQKIANSIIG